MGCHVHSNLYMNYIDHVPVLIKETTNVGEEAIHRF